MQKMVVEYFQNVFSEHCRSTEGGYENIERVVTKEHNVKLVSEISFQEFTTAVKQIHPDMASGPDGLNPAFFQQFWSSLGRDVFSSCNSWLAQLLCVTCCTKFYQRFYSNGYRSFW